MVLPGHIDNREFLTLLNVLLKLKDPEELGGQPEKIWVGETVLESLRRLENWQSDPGLIAESKATLRRLKDTSTLLVSLQESLTKATNVLENTLLPLEYWRGLSCLPDYILSDIFEIVHAECIKSSEECPHVKLSLVNRRFRDIVSNSPRLWRSIPERSTERTMYMFLEKSKEAGLKLRLDLDFSKSSLPRALVAAVPHIRRWEDLTLVVRDSFDYEKLFTMFHERYLPRLRSLSVYHPGINYKQPFVEMSHVHFYNTWDLTKLRSFKIDRAIPRPFTAPLLTTLTIKIYDESDAVDIGELIRFISAYRTLGNIDVGIEDCSLVNYPTVDVAVLENVKSLKVRLIDLASFMKTICVPNVREMELHCTDPKGCHDDGHCLGSVLWQESYPHLESLTFIYLDLADKYDLPLHKTPKLRFLKLVTPFQSPYDDALCTLPPLRELHVVCCFKKWRFNVYWVPWLEFFSRCIEKQNRRAGFEKLVIGFKNLDATTACFDSITELAKLFGTMRTDFGCDPMCRRDSGDSELQIRFLS